MLLHTLFYTVPMHSSYTIKWPPNTSFKEKTIEGKVWRYQSGYSEAITQGHAIYWPREKKGHKRTY